MTAPIERLSKSERKQRNQRQLMIQAARKLFEIKPYDDVSMEDIADESAVSKQTLYNYFSSKDSIYFGIGIDNFRDAVERVDAIEFSSLSGKELVLTLCEIFFDTLIDFPLGIEISRRFTAMNDEMDGVAQKTLQKRAAKKSRRVEKKRSVENVLADYLEQVWKYEEYWKKAIQRGQKDGTILSNLSGNQLMYYTSILINGVASQIPIKRKPIMSALKQGYLDVQRIQKITLRLVENLLQNEV